MLLRHPCVPGISLGVRPSASLQYVRVLPSGPRFESQYPGPRTSSMFGLFVTLLHSRSPKHHYLILIASLWDKTLLCLSLR